MKIYTTEQHQIIAIDIEPNNMTNVLVFEVDQTRTELFGNNCDAVIQGYKYEPQYELLFDEDGNNVRDPITGEVMCKLDDNGEKIFIGYACYPFIDYNTLMLTQKQYESQQADLLRINSQLLWIAMMTGTNMEVFL